MNICDYQKLGGQRYKKILWGGGSKLVLGSPWCRAAVRVAGPKKQETSKFKVEVSRGGLSTLLRWRWKKEGLAGDLTRGMREESKV